MEAERPALILLDLGLPVIDGFEILSRLGAMTAWAELPVIVLTGRDVTQEDRARLAGVQGILTKGGDVRSDVIGEVRKILRLKPAQSHAGPVPARV